MDNTDLANNLRLNYKSEKYYIGAKFKNIKNCEFEILGKCKNTYNDYYIKFLDKFGYITKVNSQNIKIGNIKNPYYKANYGVGHIGIGYYKPTKNSKNAVSYTKWLSMIQRCYDKNYLKLRPTYENITVCEEWHNYQNFAEWYNKNKPNHISEKHLRLDKDLFQLNNKEKIYSSETCIVIPYFVNDFLRDFNKYKGVSFSKIMNKWEMRCSGRFSNGNNVRCYYNNKEEAMVEYKKIKNIHLKNCIAYLKSLGYNFKTKKWEE